MTSHVSAQVPHGALRGVVGFQSKFVYKICEKMIVKNACKPTLGYAVPHSLPIIEACAQYPTMPLRNPNMPNNSQGTMVELT